MIAVVPYSFKPNQSLRWSSRTHPALTTIPPEGELQVVLGRDDKAAQICNKVRDIVKQFLKTGVTENRYTLACTLFAPEAFYMRDIYSQGEPLDRHIFHGREKILDYYKENPGLKGKPNAFIEVHSQGTTYTATAWGTFETDKSISPSLKLVFKDDWMFAPSNSNLNTLKAYARISSIYPVDTIPGDPKAVKQRILELEKERRP